MLLRRPDRIAAFLAILTSVGPISTDMYLPAFPAIRASLDGDTGSTQLTLAAWFVGLSVGQITFGPLSDHLGRRKPLLIGTTVYALASVGCALSFSIASLSLCRIVAAFGGAASLVIPRAIIRDLVSDNFGAARLISRLVLVMGIVPMLAPALGSFVATEAGWRAIFWLAAAYGAGCSFAIWRKLPDTLPRGLRIRQRTAQVIVTYATIAGERTFLSHTLEGSFATFSLFAFLGGAPPVFEKGFGLTPFQFGLVFVLTAGAYVGGANVNARMLPRFGPDRVLTAACLGLLCSATALLGLSLAGPTVTGVILSITAEMFFLGFVLPGAAIGSILPHAARAGSASALYGTIVFFIGAVGTVVVGLLGGSRPTMMAAVMLLGGLLAFGADRMRSHRRPPTVGRWPAVATADG